MLPTMLMLGFIISVEFLFNFVCSDSLAVVALLDVFLLGCGWGWGGGWGGGCGMGGCC